MKRGGVDVLSGASIVPPLGKMPGNGVCSPDVGNGYPNGPANVHGRTTNAHVIATSNGIGNGLANCHAESDDDEDFFGADERSCCSDSEFQDARDTTDFSSDSEGSSVSHTPSKASGGYRSLLSRLHDEQAKCAALEVQLQKERARIAELEQVAGSVKELGMNGLAAPGGSSGHKQMGPLIEREKAADEYVLQRPNSEAELAVARMVSAAVGRAAGKVEAVVQLEAELHKKEKEISRLRDKLQYWERMNQEMSQQNTHAIEMLRQRRRMWKTVYRVTYAVGAVGLGIGLLAALNLASSSFGSASSEGGESKSES